MYRKKRQRGKRGRQRREGETRQKKVNEGERGKEGGWGDGSRKRGRKGKRGACEGGERDFESCGNVWPRQERREQGELKKKTNKKERGTCWQGRGGAAGQSVRWAPYREGGQTHNIPLKDDSGFH